MAGKSFLRTYIQQMRIHRVESTMEELRVTFSFRTSGVADHYYGNRFTISVMVGITNPKNWGKRWLFTGVNGKELVASLPGPTESPNAFTSLTSPRSSLPSPWIFSLGPMML